VIGSGVGDAGAYDAAVKLAIEVAVRLNAVFVPVPRLFATIIQTVMINAIITPYSVAEFPCSSDRNLRTAITDRFISGAFDDVLRASVLRNDV
jgi:hypothetical protein